MGARPQAGHRNRRARHHKTSIGCDPVAAGGVLAAGGSLIECWFIAAVIVPVARVVAHGLPRRITNDTVQAMYTLARFLQMVGLTIPVLAVLAQLNQQITAGKMLGFLVASALIFLIGYTLQRSTSGGPR
jgi:hypothetical protein